MIRTKNCETSLLRVIYTLSVFQSSRSYTCSSSSSNSILESQQETQTQNAFVARDMLRHQSPSSPKTHIHATHASFENHHIRNLIHKCTRSQDVLTIINTYKDKVEIDAATFGKAMQKNNALKEYTVTIHLMDILLLHTNITPTIVEFNILFNGLCLAKNHFAVAKYLDVMVQKYKIKPDIFTFCALLKSCKATARYDEAQKYWDLMQDKFKIEPNEIAYNELMLVYSKANKKWRVTELFSAYLNKLKQNELLLNVILFQTYLNIFCRLGDVTGMLCALELLTSYGIEYNPIIYLYVMRCYLKNRQIDKCIDTFNELLASGLAVDKSHFALKCMALINTMKHNINNYQRKLQIYHEIEDIVYNEIPKYGWKVTQMEYRLLLQASIVLYHNIDPMQMVQLLEKLVNEKCIGYRNICKYTGKVSIDLHGFEKSEAQLIIRYMIAFVLSDRQKYEEWMKHDVLDDYFVILTGKGRHSSGKASHQANLRQFVMKELMSYDPAIKSEIDPHNTGQIKIHKSDLQMYIGNDSNGMNHAMERLTVASNDWWMDDVNERKKLRKPNVIQYCYEYNKIKRYQDRNGVSIKKLHAMTSVFSEGKEIQLYDEEAGKWCKWIIKKHVDDAQFILYDIDRNMHKCMNLNGLLQVA